MRRSLSEIERRSELEKARDKAGEQLERARLRLEPLQAQRTEARAASRRFNKALAEVYRDPAAARRELHERARRDGIGAASAEIAQNPDQFGTLRGVQVGPVRSAERIEAIRKATMLEHLGGAHLSTHTRALANRDAYDAARREVVALGKDLTKLDSELGRSTGTARMSDRLAREFQSLRPEQRRTLQRALPLPQRRILSAAMLAAQSFAREQGHER